MVSADIDKSGIASNVINAIRIGTGYFKAGKIVTLNFARLLGGKPLLAAIVVVANQLFLFSVYRNNRAALPQAFLNRDIDVPNLRIAIGVVRALLSFAIALQAIGEVVKHLRNLHMADRMFLMSKFPGNGPRAFTNPAQCRLRIAARLLINQQLQRLRQTRIGLRDGIASRAGPTDTTHQRLNFSFAFANLFARQPARQKLWPNLVFEHLN
jgi:hypothetical protein